MNNSFDELLDINQHLATPKQRKVLKENMEDFVRNYGIANVLDVLTDVFSDFSKEQREHNNYFLYGCFSEHAINLQAAFNGSITILRKYSNLRRTRNDQ